MVRKLMIAVVLFLFLLSCGKEFESESVNSSSQDDIRTRPNIILILADDVGYEIPTANGGQSYYTPNLDMMANEGIRFTNCFSSPLCSPSRIMLMSGKYSFRNYTDWGKMDTSILSIADRFRNVNYQTGIVGKWQFDGGDASIRALGFDSYLVDEPFPGGTEDRYKNPILYQDGNYLPDSITKGKYSEDLFKKYAFDFIDSCKNRAFFLYYSMNLGHFPYTPPPDHPDFQIFEDKSNTSYYPSMVQYMDKIVGEIISKAPENTIIIFVGDNGTGSRIISQFNNISVTGGKNTTTVYGTRSPLFVYWKGNLINKIDSSLIDFTDFYPTLSSLAEMHNLGNVDGISFADNIRGITNESHRTSSFCHFDPYPRRVNEHPIRWVQNTTYKLYDTTNVLDIRNGKLYNIITDPLELYPVTPDSSLLPLVEYFKIRLLELR